MQINPRRQSQQPIFVQHAQQQNQQVSSERASQEAYESSKRRGHYDANTRRGRYDDARQGPPNGLRDSLLNGKILGAAAAGGATVGLGAVAVHEIADRHGDVYAELLPYEVPNVGEIMVVGASAGGDADEDGGCCGDNCCGEDIYQCSDCGCGYCCDCCDCCCCGSFCL